MSRHHRLRQGAASSTASNIGSGRSTNSDLEAYLARASDIHDLERRMRYVERNGVHPYY